MEVLRSPWASPVGRYCHRTRWMWTSLRCSAK
jgi:hypothetical protein